ncbi:MAG: VWA domain-containing protein [Anaerolineae bacterium]|nr:MAG: VWA domain-containing protein [Anaerolineae bacterium]
MATGYLDNFYARLGVGKRATADDIRHAYHAAARRLHPDASANPDDTELFLQIQEAYEILSNPQKRQDYDKLLPDDIDPPADVMVNAIYSRSILPTMESAQLVYVLMDLLSRPTEEDRKKPSLNVCLLLDTSTSMSGQRLEMVKSTATTMVKALQPEDYFSLITFNDRAEVIVSAERGVDLGRVEARISQLNTGGGTEMLHGLKAAMNEVARNLGPSFVNQILLVTDGRTYGDDAACLEVADFASNRGITISGLGIGHEWNDEFLDELCRKTGGSSSYAARPDDIRRLLEKQFQNISRTYANNVSIAYKSSPDVELRYAFRLSPDPSALRIATPVHFGNIPLGPSLSVLMEFLIHRVPEGSREITLLDGDLNLKIPTRKIPDTTARVSLARPAAKDAEVEPPPQVLVKAMSRLSLYRMQEKARQEIEAGDIEKGTARLNSLAVQLLSAGRPDLAHTVRLELKNLQNGNSVSEDSKKQIKYGTRALVLPNGE